MTAEIASSFADRIVDVSALASASRVHAAHPVRPPDVSEVMRSERLQADADYAELEGDHRKLHVGCTLVRDAFLVWPGLVTSREGWLLAEERAFLSPLRVEGVLERAYRGAVPDFGDVASGGPTLPKAVLLAGAVASAWGHWLMDFLPAAAVLNDSGRFAKWPLIIPSQTPDWAEALVDVFGLGSERVLRLPLQERRRFNVERLAIPWLARAVRIEGSVKRRGGMHPAVRPCIERAAARFRGASSSAARIFVSRAGLGADAKRTLRNREEIEAIFAEQGFSIVRPERMEVDDQIRLFADARIIAGEAGSGLHGAMFAGDGARVIELRPETHGSWAQASIAVLLGQGFITVRGVQDGDGDPGLTSWALDPDRVRGALAAALQG